jgi:hypothetical protein
MKVRITDTAMTDDYPKKINLMVLPHRLQIRAWKSFGIYLKFRGVGGICSVRMVMVRIVPESFLSLNAVSSLAS